MAQQHKPTPAATAANAVTAHTSFSFGASELFAVQAGVPLSAAMDDLSLLIGTAQAAARQVASSRWNIAGGPRRSFAG